jgi:hypothetical protein
MQVEAQSESVTVEEYPAGADASVTFASLQLTVPLAAIYEGI